MTALTRVTDVVAFHGEGPFWDEERERLLSVDMLAGAVVELGADGEPVRHEYGGVAAVLRRRLDGGLVLAREHGLQRLDDELRPVGDERHALDDPAIRMNEGGCDPQGRLYIGTMAYDVTTGAGTLWRFDAEGGMAAALTGVTISNGLQWSADGATAFYSDTPTGRISRYPFDGATGAFGDRSTVVSFADGEGQSDGMAIDEEDGLWVAFWGGGAVRRYDPDGTLTEVVELPCRNVTSCTFGGPDLRTLYITTSRDGLPEGEVEPEAGSIFAVEPGVTGAHPHRSAV
ncbi:SMP-30/gluconolactonase/LRE family protein [Amnibacterium endophyticum]|uniref:SMP-30/gluconolactonase/LRE family protein n=1 Tax=Amnibacterium endophyticum TaxID=2109337 RepID=A0ABW4LEJ5_9MICO